MGRRRFAGGARRRLTTLAVAPWAPDVRADWRPPLIPGSFRAYVVDRRDDQFERGIRTLTAADLPDGEVEIRVGWSSVNYKDGLAATADGKVARAYPLVPGVDLAGVVVGSSDPAINPGDEVIRSEERRVGKECRL